MSKMIREAPQSRAQPRFIGWDEYKTRQAFPTAASFVLAHPFKTITSVDVTLEKGTTLGAGTAFATYTISGAVITIFAWVVAGTANAAATETVSVTVAGIW